MSFENTCCTHTEAKYLSFVSNTVLEKQKLRYAHYMVISAFSVATRSYINVVFFTCAQTNPKLIQVEEQRRDEFELIKHTQITQAEHAALG